MNNDLIKFHLAQIYQNDHQELSMYF